MKFYAGLEVCYARIAAAKLRRRRSVNHITTKTGGMRCTRLFGPIRGRVRKSSSTCLSSVKTMSRLLIRGVTGFVAYTLVQTPDGGISVTVCQNKTGTDESLQRAREWIQANTSGVGVGSPTVSEGSVILQLS